MYKKIKNLFSRVSLTILAIIFIASLSGILNNSTQTNTSIQNVSAGLGHRISAPLNPNSQARFQSSMLSAAASGSNTTATYYNWSGYAATTSGNPFLEVQSNFVQPSVSCTVPGAWTLFWVGFDGFTNGTVEQAGTAAQCGSNNVPTYYAWWEMYPTNNIQVMPIRVRPGDNIQANVTYNGNYLLNVTDQNTRQQYTQTAQCAQNLVCARQSAEWIVERPTVAGAYAPLANWGTMGLTNDQAANTTSFSRRNSPSNPVIQPASVFSNTPIYMVDYPDTGEVLASVSNLSRSGNQFSDSWNAAQ